MPQKYSRKYGVAQTLDFVLFEADGVDFRVDAAHAAGDTVISKDEGAQTNTTNGFTDEGSYYSIVLTATEMQAARIMVPISDQTATKVWLDDYLVVETYGNASAQNAIDFDDAVRAGLTALPNADADAAGGLVISDAGGLDLDTQLDAAISSRATPAQVNTEVVDALNVDTYAEPGQEAPGTTVSLVTKIGYLYKNWRNRKTQNGDTGVWRLYADNATTIDQTLTADDDGTTADKPEVGSGA